MKLQKLLYFSHGWFLARHSTPLINEYIEAWQYGPVVPSVYHEYKKYGSKPIPLGAQSLMWELSIEDNKARFKFNEVDRKDSDVLNLLEEVWGEHKSHDGTELSDMTHKPDPLNPWQIIRTIAEENGIRGADIPNTTIRTYFLHLATTGERF